LLDMGLSQTINISNNSMFSDTTLMEEYLNDSTIVGRIFNDDALGLVGEDALNGFYYENVNFENPPVDADIKNQIDYDMDDNLLIEDTPDWSIPEPPNGIYHLDVPFSFNYSNSVAASGATDGGQLGDRNWTASPTVGIANAKQLSNSMRVYPTPASSNVNIEFSIDNRERVQMTVFDLSGKKVSSLVNKMYPAGSHRVNWDLSSKLKSGIYLINMQAGDNVSTARLIVK
ncbi:MAG: T9SS type A sorting domain-containing protein, partial [Bacteroidales bacterium]|nr:T9SS type A sorting domain-containing protein [Bacteroidales bacterium]